MTQAPERSDTGFTAPKSETTMTEASGLGGGGGGGREEERAAGRQREGRKGKPQATQPWARLLCKKELARFTTLLSVSGVWEKPEKWH